MDVYVAGKRVHISPKKAVGEGGEADVYALGSGLALKLFKQPDHPDLAAFPDQQREATKRLAVHQRKLPAFPQGLPDRVIALLDAATDRPGRQILGYTMRFVQAAAVLLRYGEKTFRQQGIGASVVTAVFRDLHATVRQLHAADIIIGDFNDLNVLVRDTQAYLIDADSFQFGQFLCQVYTERFVDPLLCDPRATHPILTQPYGAGSDWYAFAVMLFRALLLVDPYGGVYKPKSASQQLPHSARPLYRITVFHPAVKYPKPAYRYDILPDELLQYFQQVFTHDQRGAFPLALLDNLRWITCPQCHLEYARAVCPACGGTASPSVHAVVSVRGQATAKKVVEVSGRLIWASTDNGTLRYLVHTSDTFCREGQQRVFSGRLHPHLTFRLLPDYTLVGQGNQTGAAVRCQSPRTSASGCL
jgi:DNA-binding helix-hairpin-helix protein with protein kinase domain